MVFNINDYVRIRLTDVGLDLVRRASWQYEFQQEDDGRYRVQLWILMNRLGPWIHMAGPQLIENNEIVFV